MIILHSQMIILLCVSCAYIHHHHSSAVQHYFNKDNNKISLGFINMIRFSLKVATNILQENLPSSSKNSPKSVLCSPLLIDTMLYMTSFGSTHGSLDQLLEPIGCTSVNDFLEAASMLAGGFKKSKGVVDDDDAPKISSSNYLGVHQCYCYLLNTRFVEVLRNMMHTAEIKIAEIANQDDEFIEEEPKGITQYIISQAANSNDTKPLLAMVNALNFKGTWVEKFNPLDTEYAYFNLLNGYNIKVPFMNKTCTYFDYGTFEGSQVLRMKYNEEQVSEGEKTRTFSMYIFLPEKKDGLSTLLGKIQMDTNMFKDKIKLKNEMINKLSIPKFVIECEFSLCEPMKKYGLTLPFHEYCRDLTGFLQLSEKEEQHYCCTCHNYGKMLYVSVIYQTCCIETDEQGTKFVLVTEVQMSPAGFCSPPLAPPAPITFVADHPFMFMVREDCSGTILLVGTMLHPLHHNVFIQGWKDGIFF